ncbi:MAG: UDP-N-acetylmuramoyl-tripeptide--D-alanyl-D-alanine ligase [Erysipelotrichaceae bacterium]
MNDILRIILFFAWGALLLVPGKRALHMFQQNRYELRRYLPWLKSRADQLAKNAFLAVLFYLPWIAIAFLTNVNLVKTLSLILISGTASFLIRRESKQKYIKPLVVTSRVKRQIAVMAILDVILLLPLTIYASWQVVSIISPILMVANWAILALMAVLTSPIEDLVKDYYINRARKILKAHPDLIKVGITGSYGKTSSKNILAEILGESYYVLASPASFNTPMGLTITIREQLKSIHDVFIAEMGADKVGEIDFLSKFIQPQYGIVTSVGPQHLNTFKSIDNILVEKMKLIENLPVSGVGVLNKDNAYMREYEIKNKCRILWYGIEQEEVDYRAIDIRYSPEGSQFTVRCAEGEFAFETILLGQHNIANILASIALARTLGISWEKLQKAVSQVNYIEHRLQLKKINGYTFIDNAFNSNPEGSKMSLEVLKGMPGKRIIITPGMIDLGDQQDELNRLFGTYMIGCADEVILVGKNQTKAVLQGLEEVGFPPIATHVVDTVKEAFAIVYTTASKEDTILLENDLPDAFNR